MPSRSLTIEQILSRLAEGPRRIETIITEHRPTIRAINPRTWIKKTERIVNTVLVWQEPPLEQASRQLHKHEVRRNTMDKIDLHQGMTLPQVFYTEWKRYQDQIKQAIAPLTADQLRLRAAPDLRPIGENVAHIIATRVGWFNNYIEENDPQIAPLREWDDPDVPQPERSAAELVAGMDESWQFMQDRFDRWTPADLAHTFPHDDPEWRDTHVTSRSWVVWHVLEHDLHHGGEVSLTLGMHGLPAPQL